MLSESRRRKGLSVGWVVALAAAGWLILISLLHYQLNYERSKRDVLCMGYMPVISNLAAPLLDFATRNTSGLRFEALKFGSFAEMGEALRNDQIQAAFIIAPLSVVLHRQAAGVRIVYIGNRHESTLVFRRDLAVKDFSDLAGRTIAVPLRFSGHNLAVRRLAEKYGLSGPRLNIVEMNPPDMASALASGVLDAYFVGEPFAARTVHAGESKVLHYVEQVWPNFICNLCLVTQRFIDQHPEQVQMLVQGAARSGLWARDHIREASEIAASYWNTPLELVEWTLMHPPNRVLFDQYLPKHDEIQYLADEMVRFGLVKSGDVTGLVDDSFARKADVSGVTDFNSIIAPLK